MTYTEMKNQLKNGIKVNNFGEWMLIKTILEDKTQDEIIKLADKVQDKGFRLCPRNLYKDEKAKQICKTPCRKRYATCFKEYFKEI